MWGGVISAGIFLVGQRTKMGLPMYQFTNSGGFWLVGRRSSWLLGQKSPHLWVDDSNFYEYVYHGMRISCFLTTWHQPPEIDKMCLSYNKPCWTFYRNLQKLQKVHGITLSYIYIYIGFEWFLYHMTFVDEPILWVCPLPVAITTRNITSIFSRGHL